MGWFDLIKHAWCVLEVGNFNFNTSEMTKLYKINTPLRLLRLAMVTVAVLLATSFNGYAQLSGTYTVDATSSASNNFKTFTALVDSLNSAGVSGAVTVNVAMATYNESFTLTAVSGTSATNTITINGNGATIYTTSSKAVMELNGTDYMMFKNLKIDVIGKQYAQIF